MKNLKKVIFLLMATILLISCQEESTVLLEDSELNSKVKSEIKVDLSTIDSPFDPNWMPPKLDNVKRSLSKSLIAPPETIDIAILGGIFTSQWMSLFNNNGYNSFLINSSSLTNGDLDTIDVLFIHRGMSTLNSTQIIYVKEFVENGGILITEYTQTQTALYNYGFGTPPTGYSYRGGNGNIINMNLSHPIAQGLPPSFRENNQLGYYYAYNNLDPDFEIIGSTEHDVNNDFINDPIGATYCYGNGVWVAFFTDFGDLTGSTTSYEQLLSINMIEFALDSCDRTDTDEDGIFDSNDNCIDTPNPDQADFDDDGMGDTCDDDDDNDGRIDSRDSYQFSNTDPMLILNCYLDIENQEVRHGKFMNDEIQEVIDMVSALEDVSDSKRTSKFRRKMYIVVNYWWYKYRLISSREKRQILDCVNQMSYPFNQVPR